MGWGAIKENENSDYTKLEAGKTVKLHILGKEPDVKYQHWVGKEASPCSAPDCDKCRQGVKRSARFSLKVYNMDLKKVELLESGVSVFSQINAIREALEGNLDAVDLMISRTGSGANDTRYSVVNVPTKFKAEMAPEQEAAPF